MILIHYNSWRFLIILSLIVILIIPFISLTLNGDKRVYLLFIILLLSILCVFFIRNQIVSVDRSLMSEVSTVKSILSKKPRRNADGDRIAPLNNMVSDEYQKFIALGVGVSIVFAFTSVILLDILDYKVIIDENKMVSVGYMSVVSGMVCSIISLLRIIMHCSNRLFVPYDRKWSSLSADAVESRVQTLIQLENTNSDLIMGLTASIAASSIGIITIVLSMIELRFTSSPDDGSIGWADGLLQLIASF